MLSATRRVLPRKRALPGADVGRKAARQAVANCTARSKLNAGAKGFEVQSDDLVSLRRFSNAAALDKPLNCYFAIDNQRMPQRARHHKTPFVSIGRKT